MFYTRHEFVDDLLSHSLLPALDDHLAEVKNVAQQDSTAAARRLFDFSVVDPAMGSAHFLTAALDVIADRIEIFLVEVGGLPGIAQLLSELSQDHGPVVQQPEDGDLLRRLILKRCIYGYECLVEVVIKPLAQRERVLEVLKTLNDSLWADLVYVETTDGGTCIVSSVRESSSFLNSLPKMPSVYSWALTYM